MSRIVVGPRGVRGEGWVSVHQGSIQSVALRDQRILEASQSLQKIKIYQALCSSLTRNSYRLYSIDFLFLIEITQSPFESINIMLEFEQLKPEVCRSNYSPTLDIHFTVKDTFRFFSGRNYFSGAYE